jgi:glycosyltransferase involved in cell wall biosynthesis
MTRTRALYFLYQYPQISETYIKTEIESVRSSYDLRVLCLKTAKAPYRNHLPFTEVDDPEAVRDAIEEFRPDVLHTHWLNQVPTLAYFSGYFSDRPARRPIPFTVRAHSFDVLDSGPGRLERLAPILNHDLCLGILTFPFTRPRLEAAGVRPEKIRDCFPVVNYARFHDRSPNGSAVMNVGACLPKKRMEDFLELGRSVPEFEFNLYALGYNVDEMTRLNERAGRPVDVVPPVEPDEMAAEYKKHRWLVYTADYQANTVGWPMAVAEAQAAGVGVCVPNLRPDLRDYVGEAGFLYNSIGEVADLIKNPYPEELREIGFEHAKKSDAFRHSSILTDLWDSATRGRVEGQSVSSATSAGFDWKAWSWDWEWREAVSSFGRDVDSRVPAGASLILVDEAQLGTGSLAGHPVLPFPEREGGYWGLPESDEAAVEELDRLRGRGAGFLAVAWPSFWWLDHYTGFAQTLRDRFPCLVKNDRLILFDLRKERTLLEQRTG